LGSKMAQMEKKISPCAICVKSEYFDDGYSDLP
jgi:hypothetical protein